MQYGRPSFDVENPGGWSTEPLWNKIEEEPFDDGDFVESPKTATGDSFTIGLSGFVDPQVHTGHIVRIRVETGVSGIFKYELMQGAVVIKDSGDVVLTTAFAEYNMILSEAEAANITDYAALRVRVTAVATQKNQRQNVSWIRVDIPDVAGEEHSGSGSISGNGSAIGIIKKGGLGSAIKSAGGVLLAIGLAGMLVIASIAGGGSQTGIGEKSTTKTVNISSSGSQIIVGKKDTSNNTSISGGGSLTATGVRAEGEPHFGIASIFGNGVITGIATKQVFYDLPMSGGGLLVVTGEAAEYHFGIVSISENGILASISIKQAIVDVAIGANGILSGIGTKQNLGDLIITGGGLIVATGEKYEAGEEHSGNVVISGNGGINGVTIKQALSELAIVSNGILIGSGIKQTFSDLIIAGGGSIIIVGIANEIYSGIVTISGNGIIICLGNKAIDISDLIAIKIMGHLR